MLWLGLVLGSMCGLQEGIGFVSKYPILVVSTDWGVLFVGVLILKALPFGVYTKGH